ncbi:MAG: threonine/serine exporter family protein [Xanthomonadaceae bacterium]|nr:threonine/serine exporter family protein [Xanthomonadaceae bacterium]MDE2226055.1 threonine/serine exporter family protein [Xanthomonadaceae bacterium]
MTASLAEGRRDEQTRARVAFVIELARRLHQYGAAAPRLEQAIGNVAQQLGLACDVLSTPTSIVLSFSAPGGDGLADITQVVRIAPGDVNLARLCRADEIADRVADGSLDPRRGMAQLRALGRPLSRAALWATIVSYGLSAASVAVLFRTSGPDALAAGVIGVLIGGIVVAGYGRPRLSAASDAIAALVATFIATMVSAWLLPLSLKLVVLSALIVLVPGMSLTNAVRELTSQHLASGVARFAGAAATILKLTFGTIAAAQVCAVAHIVPAAHSLPPLPPWMQWPALLVAAVAFAMLFQTALRDYPLVLVAVIVGYLVTYWSGNALGTPFGVFIGGLVLSSGSNLYARIMHRPGALVREPGVLLLVPGSVGFRSVSDLLNNQIASGSHVAVLLVTMLISLVAGLLFGDLLVAPRRSL